MSAIPFFDKFFDGLIRQAEKLIASDGAISKLIDDVFLKIGEGSEMFYAVQDSVIALARMLKFWWKGEYKNISYQSVLAVVAALIYFANPFDLIPDFIPIIGQIDDVFVISYLVRTLNKEIERFMAWEKAHTANPVADPAFDARN